MLARLAPQATAKSATRRRSIGASTGRLDVEHAPRGKDAAGVERRLQSAHRGDFLVGAAEGEEAGLGDADAVLGADRAAELGGEAEDGLVEGVVLGAGAEQVDVDVAVAEVAVEVELGAVDRGDQLVGAALELGQGGGRHGDIEFVGYAAVADRLVDQLTTGPEPLA